MICVDLGNAPCRTVCNACRDWAAPRWHHHPGAAVAHILASDGVAGLCGAHQPGRWPDKWEHGDGGLRHCEICEAAS